MNRNHASRTREKLHDPGHVNVVTQSFSEADGKPHYAIIINEMDNNGG